MADEPKPWRWVWYNFGGDAFWDMRKDALQGRLVDAEGNTILWATTTVVVDPRVEVATEEIARAIENAGQAFKTIAELGPLSEEEFVAIEAGDQPGRIAGTVTGEVRFVPDEPKPLTDEELDYLLVRIDRAALPALLRLVAEVRRLRAGEWIDLAADEIAGDPSVRDGGTDRIADVIRGHLEAAAKKQP